LRLHRCIQCLYLPNWENKILEFSVSLVIRYDLIFRLVVSKIVALRSRSNKWQLVIYVNSWGYDIGYGLLS